MSNINANKKVEVHEAFVAEWLKRECLCLENLAELFQIFRNYSA